MIKLFELKALFAQRVLDDPNSSLEACEAFAAILASNPVLFSRRDEFLAARPTVNSQKSCRKCGRKERKLSKTNLLHPLTVAVGVSQKLSVFTMNLQPNYRGFGQTEGSIILEARYAPTLSSSNISLEVTKKSCGCYGYATPPTTCYRLPSTPNVSPTMATPRSSDSLVCQACG